MKNVYLLGNSIISPLGFTTAENFEAISSGKSGISKNEQSGLYEGRIDTDLLNDKYNSLTSQSNFSKLEKIMILAVQDVLSKNTDLNLEKTLLIVSTTKGNITDLQLKNRQKSSVYLAELSLKISKIFNFPNEPITLSNACISGGLGIAVGKRFIQAGIYDHALVVGGDILSGFVTSGFQSFQAISKSICQPYSKNRDGINLGEAAACLLMGTDKPAETYVIKVIADSISNDANHISGPSRTGEGLIKCVKQALKEAEVKTSDIDFISAHGTATIFNDEMESLAFNQLSLQNVPLNSFKGYYGHTLGASALIESIITQECMLRNILLPSLNFSETGTSQPLHIITKKQEREINVALKTASGFGGCNLALLFEKV